VNAKYGVPKTAFGGMLVAVFLGLISLAGSTSAQQGPSGYHVSKTVKLVGPGGWDYLAIDSDGRKLFIARDSHVAVLNADTGDTAGDFAGTPGVHGVAIATDLGRGFTSNGRANNVTIFDLKTLKPVGQVPTGKEPDAIVYDPASRRVFAMNGGSHNATAIDAATGKVDGTVKFPGSPEFAVADGHGAVFVNIKNKSALTKIDSRSLKVTNEWSLAPCESPSGLAIDTDNARLFVACDNKMMAVADANSGKVITTVPTGEGADAIRFDPGTRLAFSSNGDSGTLTVIHQDAADTYSVLENVKTGEGARTMELDSKTHNVYVVTAKLVPAEPYPKPAPGTVRLLILAK
jgi:DNA-binding beta-propeller fold protein YncE